MSTCLSAGETVDGDPRVSVILPIGRDGVGLEDVIRSYAVDLCGLGADFELILVVEPSSPDLGPLLAHRGVVVVRGDSSRWGAKVRAGLAVARGDLLCYLDWTQTPAQALSELLSFGLRDATLVLRATRRTRETLLRRVSSLFFNLECRALLGVTAWDVNGTPKAFWRDRAGLLGLERDDALIDAEFCMICQQQRLPVVEIPIDTVSRSGRPASYSLLDGLRMILAVPELKRRGHPPD